MNKEDLEFFAKEAGKTPVTQMKEFLFDFEEQQRKSNALSLVFTIIGAVSSTIAAITGLILLLQ